MPKLTTDRTSKTIEIAKNSQKLPTKITLPFFTFYSPVISIINKFLHIREDNLARQFIQKVLIFNVVFY